MKEFLKAIASEEKENIDYKLLSRQILISPKKSFSFFQNHGDLYNFFINALYNESLDCAKLLQAGFLKDLMNGFKVNKKIEKSNEAKDLYLILLGNQNKTVNDIFLKTHTDIQIQIKIT